MLDHENQKLVKKNEEASAQQITGFLPPKSVEQKAGSGSNSDFKTEMIKIIVFSLLLLLAFYLGHQTKISEIAQQSDLSVEPKDQSPERVQISQKQFNEKISLVDGIHLPNPQHRNDLRIFNYSTVGVPIPGQQYNATKVSPQYLHIFDNTVNSLFKPYNVKCMLSKDTNCQYVRLGNETESNDGGYVICNNFINGTQGLITVGVNGFDNFGCELTTVHSMPNYQYDCTNPQQPVCESNENTHFSEICLGEQTQKSQKYTFISLQDILRSTNLLKKRIFLKIDSEGGEYPGLKYFPTEYLDYIDQFILELHFVDLYPEEWGMLDIFRTLMTKFVSVNMHMNNNDCLAGRKLKANAFQVTLVNRKLIKIHRKSRSFALHKLNTINNANKPDCQMQ